MHRPYLKRNLGTLMVAWYKIDRCASFGHPEKGFHGFFDQGIRKLSSKEQVPSMHNQVNFTPHRRLQGSFKIGEEVVTPSPALDPWFERKIESQMGVGDQ
jgi:hypothetical protein